MKNLEALKKKIIEANPEKFGCYFVSPHSWADGESFDSPRCGDCWCTIREVHTHSEKVFRLADVLLAIEKAGLSKHFIVLPSGNIYLFESGTLGQPSGNWNLREDDLEKQSEETLAFLEKIIL